MFVLANAVFAREPVTQPDETTMIFRILAA